MPKIQHQWRNRGSRRAWENIPKPDVFWLQMEYRKVRADGPEARAGAR